MVSSIFFFFWKVVQGSRTPGPSGVRGPQGDPGSGPRRTPEGSGVRKKISGIGICLDTENYIFYKITLHNIFSLDVCFQRTFLINLCLFTHPTYFKIILIHLLKTKGPLSKTKLNLKLIKFYCR